MKIVIKKILILIVLFMEILIPIWPNRNFKKYMETNKVTGNKQNWITRQ